jgi:hypothetical protein
MFRKLILAVAAIGATALAPTAASAHMHGGHGHWGHHHWFGGFGFYGPSYIVASDCYFVDRVVYTPFGKRIRRVEVCD